MNPFKWGGGEKKKRKEKKERKKENYRKSRYFLRWSEVILQRGLLRRGAGQGRGGSLDGTIRPSPGIPTAGRAAARAGNPAVPLRLRLAGSSPVHAAGLPQPCLRVAEQPYRVPRATAAPLCLLQRGHGVPGPSFSSPGSHQPQPRVVVGERPEKRAACSVKTSKDFKFFLTPLER